MLTSFIGEIATLRYKFFGNKSLLTLLGHKQYFISRNCGEHNLKLISFFPNELSLFFIWEISVVPILFSSSSIFSKLNLTTLTVSGQHSHHVFDSGCKGEFAIYFSKMFFLWADPENIINNLQILPKDVITIGRGVTTTSSNKLKGWCIAQSTKNTSGIFVKIPACIPFPLPTVWIPWWWFCPCDTFKWFK